MSANANVIDINAQSNESALAPIGERAGHLGVEIADIAGLIEDLAGVGAQQDRQIHEVMAAARDMNETTSNLDQAMEETARAAQQSRGILELSAQKITNVVDGSITTMTALGEGALDVRDTLRSVQETAGAVQKASTAIGQIARETKLLALNASVEAARAGDAGAGFAIIASAVKSLADQIGNFSGQIEGELKSMAGAIDTLTRQTETNATTAQKARAESEAAREASADLAELVVSVDRLVADIEAMRAPIARNTEGFLSVKTGLDALSQASDVSQLHLDSARDRAHSILKISEDFILFIAESGVETSDTPLIALAKQTADKVAETFTEAVARGEITMDALFDTRYRDIPGTDPKQVLARFTALTDKYLPGIQEPVLKFDPRIMFCAAVDLNGYLPTHNAIYSRPQGTDPVWNAANCRNRRIFNDRTGLSAGQSTKPFLLQTYRRDMGGGNFVLMKDCSAPIMVNGRHWGGLRIAYKVD